MATRWHTGNRSDPRLDAYWGWAHRTGFKHLLTAGDQLRLVARVKPSQDLDQVLKTLSRVASTPATSSELSASPYLTLSVPLSQLDDALIVILQYCDRVELSSPIVAAELRLLPKSVEEAPARSKTDVVLGYIDDACPFAHRAWRGRILGLWEQGRQSVPVLGGREIGEVSELGYGVEYHRSYGVAPSSAGTSPLSIAEVIAKYQNSAGGLDEEALYADAGFAILARRDSHGAHVLDLLAGRVPLSSRLPPNPVDSPSWAVDTGTFAATADIVAVQLSREAIKDTSGRWLADKVLDGLRFILRCVDPANTKRVVVNVSYGPTSGPHDGSAILESALDALCSYYDGLGGRPKLEVVLPAGNSFEWQAHAAEKLKKDVSATLCWRVVADGYRPSHIELWFPDGTDPGDIEVSVMPPGGPMSPPFATGTHELQDDAGGLLATASWQQLVGNGTTAKLNFLLALEPTANDRSGWTPAPAGDWQIKVTNHGEAGLAFDAFVQRGSTHMHFRRTDTISWLVSPDYDPEAYLRRLEDDPKPATSLVRRRGTLSGVATGERTHVATGYRRSDAKHVVYASAGPRRDGQPKLAGALPIDESRALSGVRAAGNLGASAVRLVGTSLAAPLLARRIANRPLPQPGQSDNVPLPPVPPGREEELVGRVDFPAP